MLAVAILASPAASRGAPDAADGPGGRAPRATAVTDDPAPDLRIWDLSGRRRSLTELRGDVVLVAFWATWCAPCRKELPVLSKLARESEGTGVTILGASTDGLGERERLGKLFTDEGWAFETWHAADAWDMERFGLGPQLPASVLLDRDGRVLRRFRGVLKENEVRQAIAEALAAER